MLYHGSAKKLNTLKRSQARVSEGASVPEDELLDAIYLTSDVGFAIAAAARPSEGMIRVGEQGGKKTIEFERPDLFDPNKEIFIYEVDETKIPEGRIRQIDHHQWIINDLDEIKPESVQNLLAGEVLKYFELKPYHLEGAESCRELRPR
jgi:hypothetical protein